MSSREEFEAAMRANGIDDFVRYSPDWDYISSVVQAAWMAWQSRDAEIAAKDERIAQLQERKDDDARRVRLLLTLNHPKHNYAEFFIIRRGRNGRLAEDVD